MTKDQQARFAAVLAALSELYPDWRIGQMVANIALFARGPSSEAVWEVEDDEFLAAAEAHLVRRRAGADSQSLEKKTVSRAV